MGQLERYGLYVLCLVIFLILGVAIWGGDPSQASSTTPVERQELANNTGQNDAGEQEPIDDFWRTDDGSDEVLAGMKTVDDPGPGGGAAKEEPEIGGDNVKPAPPLPKERTHTVRKGESMAVIAQRYYGSQGHVDHIKRANPQVKPERMRPNTVLRIPPLSAEPRKRGSREMRHTIRLGDNLGTISQKYYGTTRYVDKIRKANNIRNDRGLKIGQVLVIPRLN